MPVLGQMHYRNYFILNILVRYYPHFEGRPVPQLVLSVSGRTEVLPQTWPPLGFAFLTLELLLPPPGCVAPTALPLCLVDAHTGSCQGASGLGIPLSGSAGRLGGGGRVPGPGRRHPALRLPLCSVPTWWPHSVFFCENIHCVLLC